MSEGQLEQEIKLEVGVGFRLPALADSTTGERVTAKPEQLLQAVYFDTSDLRLLRHGVTLRHRKERRRPGHAGSTSTSSDAAGQPAKAKIENEWTLKLPAPSDGKGLVRKEINWPGAGSTPPKAAKALVTAYARGAELQPIAKLVTERNRTVVADRAGRPLVEVDDDTVSVMDGRRLAARFREVEVELVGDGAEHVLERVADAITRAGALPGDDRPKVARALGRRGSERPEVVAGDLDYRSTVRQVIAASIASGYQRIVEHDAGVRLDEDVEDVHQARVGTRRLRSDLRTFAPFLDPNWAAEIRSELGWLADALGEVRDADVLGERLEHRQAALDPADQPAADPLRARLARERKTARRKLIEAMNSERYVSLLDRLVAAALDPPLAKISQPAKPDAVDSPIPEAQLVPPLTTSGWRPFGVAGVVGGPGTPFVHAAAPGVPASARVGDRPASQPGVPSANGTQHVSQTVPEPAEATETEQPQQEQGPSKTVQRLQDLLEEQGVDNVGDLRAIDALVPLVRKPYKRLRLAVDALSDDPADEQLHEVRIRAKRLRYACEAVSVVVGKPAKRLAKDAAGLQGVLGDHNDAVVAADWLRGASGSAKGLAGAVVTGQLIANERHARDQCRDQWPAAWAKIAGTNRRWMKDHHQRRQDRSHRP